MSIVQRQIEQINWGRDIPAGLITGIMAVPLSVGICLMSEYPIQTGLITVIFACLVSFVVSLFKPGNYVGTPGIAAGLAPALALGVHTFGMKNMPFLVCLTAIVQAIAWRFNLQRFLLKIVPPYLVEGLLAGIGLKIVLKFLPFTYEAQITAKPEALTSTAHTVSSSKLVSTHAVAAQGHSLLPHLHPLTFNDKTLLVVALSAITMVIFIILFQRFQRTQPVAPYAATLLIGMITVMAFDLPVVKIENMPFRLVLPVPHLSASDTLPMVFKMIGYALMLATIDIIEQVMSNKGIEKLDPYGRPCDSNNSLLAIWIANLGSSLFGGMTNLDGLAKSTTNAIAGAVSKASNLFTALVILFVVLVPQSLALIPKFALGIIMIFSGWKMIAGLRHISHAGKYAMSMAVFCGIMVYESGIFEGLLISLLVHYTFMSILKWIDFQQTTTAATQPVAKARDGE